MLTLEGLVRGITTTNYKEKTDEFTGVVTPASTQHKVQIEYTQPQQSGDNKIVIEDFNIKTDDNLAAHVEKFRGCTGKQVRIPLALWKVDGKAGLAIPKGCLPTLLQARPAA